jgi:hypothetical protein
MSIKILQPNDESYRFMVGRYDGVASSARQSRFDFLPMGHYHNKARVQAEVIRVFSKASNLSLEILLTIGGQNLSINK